MQSSREAVPTNAAPPSETPPSPPETDLAKLIRNLRGLTNLISASQPLDVDDREYLSDQLAGFVEQLERLLMGTLLLHWVHEFMIG